MRSEFRRRQEIDATTFVANVESAKVLERTIEIIAMMFKEIQVE